MNISLDQLSSSIISAMQEYTQDITEAIDNEVDIRSKELLKAIKARSPIKDGQYRKGWTRKVERQGDSITITVYNKKRGSLVHLLEKGHAKRGGGRVSGKPHVEPATEQETQLLENNIKSIIQNGG